MCVGTQVSLIKCYCHHIHEQRVFLCWFMSAGNNNVNFSLDISSDRDVILSFHAVLAFSSSSRFFFIFSPVSYPFLSWVKYHSRNQVYSLPCYEVINSYLCCLGAAV